MDQPTYSSRRAQLTLFDTVLNVVQPAALIVAGAAVVSLDRFVYVIALLIAFLVLVFGQYTARLRNQSDRSKSLLEDYLQDRSNLLSVLTGIASQGSRTEYLTKISILNSIEWWFDNELLPDYYASLDERGGAANGIKFQRKPLWRRWLKNPKSELHSDWIRLHSRLRNQPKVQLIDVVFHTPHEDIASMVLARGEEEGFIGELLIPGELPSRAEIRYEWTDAFVKRP